MLNEYRFRLSRDYKLSTHGKALKYTHMYTTPLVIHAEIVALVYEVQ